MSVIKSKSHHTTLTRDAEGSAADPLGADRTDPAAEVRGDLLEALERTGDGRLGAVEDDGGQRDQNVFEGGLSLEAGDPVAGTRLPRGNATPEEGSARTENGSELPAITPGGESREEKSGQGRGRTS